MFVWDTHAVTLDVKIEELQQGFSSVYFGIRLRTSRREKNALINNQKQ